MFLALPLVSAIVFVPTLMTSPTLRVRLVGLLAIASLLCTAYMLMMLPNTKTIPVHQSRASGSLGPVSEYFRWLIIGLNLLIFLNGFIFKDGKDSPDGFWPLCILPSGELIWLAPHGKYGDLREVAVSALVMFAQQIMDSVDIEQLEKLKYPYKGA